MKEKIIAPNQRSLTKGMESKKSRRSSGDGDELNE